MSLKINCLIIFILFSAKLFSQKDQLAFNYFSDVGKYLLYKHDTVSAVNLFDSIQKEYPDRCYPNPKLLFNIGRKKEAVKNYVKLCKSGINPTFFYDYYEYEKLNQRYQKKIERAFKSFETNKNRKFCFFLDSLMDLDQNLRMGLDYSLPHLLILEEQKKFDTTIFISLYKQIKISGWPSISDIGITGYIQINFLVLHGMRYYDEDDMLFQFFQNSLKDKILTGEYWSLSFAQNYDEYLEWVKGEGQYYGSFPDENNIIHSNYSIEELNDHRKTIGLGPIEHYLEMNGFKLLKTKI